MAQKRKKQLYKQYEHDGGFVGLPRRVFKSPQYRSLSLTARCLLNELQNLYRPARNGRIVLSVEQGAEALNISYNTAKEGFWQLEGMEFIERMLDCDYSKGKAREWRLTYEPCQGREPTDEWKQHRPLPHKNRKSPSNTEKTPSKFEG